MTTTEMRTGQLAQIDVSSIVAGDNDRKAFDMGEMESLAASIERDGLAQPPTVRPLEDGRFEIVAGERRVRAMRLLGWEFVPAFVRSMTDDQASATMLVENMVRVDLDPLEEARAFASRIEQGSTVADIAQLVGVSHRTVRARLDLLRLGQDAQSLVSSGNLTLACAAQMVGLDGDRQNLALRALSAGSLTLPAFTAVCDRLRAEQQSEPMFSADLFWSVEEYVVAGQTEATLSIMARQSEPVQQLTTAEVAKMVGVKVASIRQYLTRGTFPEPDGYIGRTPWWLATTVTAWMENDRREPGWPRKTEATE
jgi:ParB family chromosome partitioning protein